jgi:signal transduction histidine kinase/ActR/RegA family two-component response regulator
VAFGTYSQNEIKEKELTLQDSINLALAYKNHAAEIITTLQFDNAISEISLANKIVTKINDLEIKADVLLTNATLQYHLQNYTQASKLNNKAIETIKISKNRKNLARAYLVEGLINTRLNLYSKADFYFKKSDSIYKVDNNELGRSSLLVGRGINELKKGNPTIAVNYFNAGITQYRKNKMPYQEAISLVNKTEALLQLEDNPEQSYLKQAEVSLKEALKIIDKRGYVKLKIDSYQIASQIALRRGNNPLALKELNTYTKKTDSIHSIYIGAISSSIDEDSSVAELKETIENQKNDLIEKEKSERLNRITNFMSIALIVILSLLTLSLYKNNNLRAKANNLLQDKNTELVLAKENAEKASLAKGQFLSTITHELRTPLYAVTGLTHLLIEENPQEHQKEHLKALKFSGEYLLSLINNILDLNKLEANKVEVEKMTFDLKKRINDVLVALKKSADDKKTILKLEFDENIPKKLSGDPLKLSQILINLIGNSVKFTQNGKVTVRVRKLDQVNRTVKLNFEIEDNGVGITKKKQKTIFETFSQGSLQINRKFGGTGLGLSIVKNLLELMNSKIELESHLGKGSKFWFNLNIEISEESAIEAQKEAERDLVDYKKLAGKEVLVVEDNKINQMITRKILEKNKMVCQVADNGMDAIQLIHDNEFDIILMDIHMPGISGIETTKKVREFNTRLPIIALTAIAIDENLDEFYKAGFNDIIPKPFKPELFFSKIFSALNKTETII